MTTTVADVIVGLESRGASVRLRQDGAITIRPKGTVTPTEMEVLTALRADAVAYLRARSLGADWSRVSLYQLDHILEVDVPWSDVRLVLAPGCRIARDLRAKDARPGRVWCVCEVVDLLLTHVTPEDARAITDARLVFDAAHAGARGEETA
jgi:hypothetical protein